MSGLATTLVRDATGLEALSGAWWTLWRRSPTATPFTSPAWLLPWWLVFAPGELATVAVWQGERLVGLAPLWVEDGELGRRVLPLGIGLSDLFDVLVDPSVPEVGSALLRAAVDLLGESCALSLEELPEGAASLALPISPDVVAEACEQSARPVLALPPGAADPLLCLPSGKRRKLRMARHRVERRAGQVEPVALDGIPGFLEDLIRLHGARWTARGEHGVLADDVVRRFHAAALPKLHGAGLARLARLVVEGRAVGAYYGLADERSAYAYLGGFDPAFSFESPGTVLIGHAIENAARAGCAQFDFLRGQEAYKYEWGAQDRINRRRTITRATLA